MNTKIGYMYRDAENYKKFAEVVVSGVIQQERLLACQKDGEFFIPAYVGLKPLQSPPFDSYDHIWHTLEFATATHEPPTEVLTAAELMGLFQQAHQNNWDESAVYKQMGLV